MSSIWGNKIKISVFGESHGTAIGVVIDSLPPGEKINLSEVKLQMNRRRPIDENLSTSRAEEDNPEIISGILNETTTGTPLCAIIQNKDANSQDYSSKEFMLRPGHADFTSYIRYKGFNDFRGGGHLSGRLTAPLVFAGAICKQILKRKGIEIGSHISSIENISDKLFDPIYLKSSLLKTLSSSRFPVISSKVRKKMEEKILEIKTQGDSIGGIVECAIIGVPAGIGNPIFSSVESKISSLVFGIPGIKGIEFGSGFRSSKMKGSENNDEFIFKNGKVQTLTNNHGGILGGIRSGMQLIFKAAFKPTPSIAKTQKTVNLKSGLPCKLNIKGRHDPCIAVRAAPAVEAAASISILDFLI